jgi:hypothetical protein
MWKSLPLAGQACGRRSLRKDGFMRRNRAVMRKISRLVKSVFFAFARGLR